MTLATLLFQETEFENCIFPGRSSRCSKRRSRTETKRSLFIATQRALWKAVHRRAQQISCHARCAPSAMVRRNSEGRREVRSGTGQTAHSEALRQAGERRHRREPCDVHRKVWHGRRGSDRDVVRRDRRLQLQERRLAERDWALHSGGVEGEQGAWDRSGPNRRRAANLCGWALQACWKCDQPCCGECFS